MSTVESDYYAFMGFDPAHTRDVLSHYVPMFAGSTPVLDLACGRGELLDLFREAGIGARGVDSDEGMVDACRARGLDVIQGDVLDVLEKTEDGSYGGVIASHFVEHIQPADALAVAEAAHRVLRPGGTFVLITPNPASLSIAGHDFWKDPTHVRFYDPALLRFLCVRAGFRDAEVGSNPRNDPGPPPRTSTQEPTVHESLIPDISDAVQRGAGKRGAKHPETDIGYLLGHLLGVVAERVMVVETELRELHRAHETLLRELYPANEVYVVAHA